jgi:imidazole glycerol-phosphate synthase subunit HisF
MQPQGAEFNPFRVIPCLLVHSDRLVKTERFGARRYVGDVMNALRIFNEKQVDEIAVLDIEAARSRRPPNMELIAELAGECFMPFAYGGGISQPEQVRAIIKAGVEKVIINTAAFEDPAFITRIAGDVGSQSIVVSIDVRRGWFGGKRVYTRSGANKTQYDPMAAAELAVRSGAGELIVHSIDRDGTMSGYDLDLVRSVAAHSPVPVVAIGGAASVSDLAAAVQVGGAAAAAAGAMFVFHGPHRAVLISYPSAAEVQRAVDQLK